MGKKILLADDSVTIQKIVELTFEGEGLELEVAADGHEALELAEASPPDLILADSTMPGLSGVELCRKIREHPVLKPIPVILLTNSFDDFNRADGDAAGVTAYVEKPFESQALLDHIHELLSEEDAHAPAPEEPAELRPPADDVDLISEEPEELLILEEIVEEETEEAPPLTEELPPPAPAEPVAAEEAEEEEELEELPVAQETPSTQPPTPTEESLVDQEESPTQPFISTMEPTRAAFDLTEEPPPPAEPSPAPPSDDVTAAAAAAGALLEESIGDSVRAYIDQLIHQAVEELEPTITAKIVERLEATFPSISERIIRDEIEKLKRGA
ncbi:MAG: response regulator [bacterium]|nr:response regulator [bacterium]